MSLTWPKVILARTKSLAVKIAKSLSGSYHIWKYIGRSYFTKTLLLTWGRVLNLTEGHFEKVNVNGTLTGKVLFVSDPYLFLKRCKFLFHIKFTLYLEVCNELYSRSLGQGQGQWHKKMQNSYPEHNYFIENKRPIGLNGNLSTIAHTKIAKESHKCIKLSFIMN